MRVQNHPLYLSVELRQPLNGAEELRNDRKLASTYGEEVKCNRFEYAKVAKCLFCGRDDGKAKIVAMGKESANVRCPSNCYSRREASAPPWVDASTDPWQVIQGTNPPPCANGVEIGVQQANVFQKREQG